MAILESDPDTAVAQSVLLLWLLGLDLPGIADLVADDEACGRAVIADRLALLLAGVPTWLPPPDDEDE